MDQPFPGVFRDGNTYYTVNRVPGEAVYGEQLRTVDGTEYRAWDAHRSKAAAAITKGLAVFPVEPDDAVLYLGASTGTTVSHVSDIAAEGVVYAVEHAPGVARKLLAGMESRDNVAPVLGDARKPDDYAPLVSEVDIIYQDVAQPDQADILLRNADRFLRDGGHAMAAIKARSISSTDDPEDVFADAREQLADRFDIVAETRLEPFHTDHLFLVLEKR